VRELHERYFARLIPLAEVAEVTEGIGPAEADQAGGGAGPAGAENP
jgi:hypothetical protein